MSVADLLVPNPYPLNLGPISSASLTVGALVVTDALGAGTMTMLTAAAEPINVNNTSATTENDITFYNNGVRTASFGVNNAANEAYAWAHPEGAAPLKFGTNGIERLRIPTAGIAINEAASNAIALVTGNTTLGTRTLDGGAYTPAYNNVSNIGLPIGGIFGLWERNGNMVTVNVALITVQVAATPAQATISLPVPPAANFAAATGVIGTATYGTAAVATAVNVSASTGSMLAVIDITVGPPGTLVADLKVTFMYRIA